MSYINPCLILLFLTDLTQTAYYMHKYLVLRLSIVLGAVLVFSQPVFAQNSDLEYGYGTIAEVNEHQVTVEEYDLESNRVSLVIYQIDETTQFDNEVLLENLNVGQHVEIDYLPQAGKKIAKIISLETKNEPEMPASE